MLIARYMVYIECIVCRKVEKMDRCWFKTSVKPAGFTYSEMPAGIKCQSKVFPAAYTERAKLQLIWILYELINEN